MSNYNEIFVPGPWGNLAVITWGQPANQPVLLLHGRQDTAATFIPIVKLLPHDYFYVGVDLPGNGRSDAFPKGLPVSRYHYIHAVHVVVKYMKWKQFILMGHSMGCEVGLFFNAVNPGLISKFIHLDPGPTFQRLQQPDHQKFYRHHYERYFKNYHRYNSGVGKEYTKRQAVEAVVKARKLSEEQAEIILSRILVPTGDDRYRFSWDPRSKYAVPQNHSNDLYIKLFTTNVPPTLIIIMTDGNGGYNVGKEGADFLIEGMLQNIKFCKKVTIEGGHDHHLTEPEGIAGYVREFLKEDFNEIVVISKAKL